MGTGLVFGAFCFSDFSFPAQIRQKAVASLHNIAVRRLKISRIPRIRNIAAGTGEGKKFVNLSIRIIFQHPVQIADIRGIHADDVVGALVILPRNLLRVMRHERNVLLAQFIDCPVVRRIADLLAAGGEAVDFKIVGKAEGIYFVGEYALSKSRAANITVANEIHSYHTPKIPSFCALSQQICSVRSYIIFIPEEKLAVIVRVKNLQQFSHIPDQIGSRNIFPVEPEDAAFLG